MKKYKKIIIVALCFALLLSMFSFSAFAYSVPQDGVLDTEGYYHINSGWTVAADSGELVGGFGVVFSSAVYEIDTIYFGKSLDENLNLISSDDSILFYLDGDLVFSMTSVDECTIQVVYTVVDTTVPTDLYEFFDDHVQFAKFNVYDYSFRFDVNENWFNDVFFVVPGVLTVDYSDDSYFCFLSLFGVDNSFNLFNENSSLDDPLLSLGSSSAFSISGHYLLESFSDDELEQLFLYVLLFFDFGFRNGTVETYLTPLPPSESLINDLFSVFGSVGSWISGAANSLIPMFWNAADGTLTFVGLLSVSALALSVVFLVLSLIEKFLRFGG